MSLATLLGCAGQRPDNLGPRDGRLAACPDSPNCVSSSDSRESHGIAPIQAPLTRIRAHLASLDNAQIITDQPEYLYVEFTSSLMGFVDDVEFLESTAGSGVQVRSASRVGYGDMGVNRKRIESIRAAVSP
ncbi:MAG: DUF1499 domain-containing protein [Pseudomonadales bacterium]|nr:DUF1499 domain-containing protein [Pseudomonadales bacterium]